MDIEFFKIHAGEVVERKVYASKHTQDGPLTGHFFITNFRLAFIANTDEDRQLDENVDLPLARISKLDKSTLSSITTTKRNKNRHCLFVQVRYIGYWLRFYFTSDQLLEEIMSKCRCSVWPQLSNESAFAFANKDTYPNTNINKSGWRLYDVIQEYRRQGINNQPNTKWSITYANADYRLCDSYPKILVIPTGSQPLLSKAAASRTNRRLPVLSWRHPTKGSVLVRSAKLTSTSNKTCRMVDEKLMDMIVMASGNTSTSITLIDARPNENAGGVEAPDISSDPWSSGHNDGSSDFHFYSRLEDSRWLDHLSMLIQSAVNVAKMLDYGSSVMVYCADGSDQTCQLCSLAMLLIDPYYRTLEGFAILIEKEWLSFGHQFWKRTHGSNNDERAPLFPHFIDCVWQIINQYPSRFEFNQRLLVDLLDALHSNQFGTFLYDSEKERLNKAANSTPSFWSHVEQHRSTYSNPLYSLLDNEGGDAPLSPKGDLKFLRLFEAYHMRWTWTTDHNDGDSEMLITNFVREKDDQITRLEQERDLMTEERSKSCQRVANTIAAQQSDQDTIEMLRQQLDIVTQSCNNQKKEMNKLIHECEDLSRTLEINNISTTEQVRTIGIDCLEQTVRDMELENIQLAHDNDVVEISIDQLKMRMLEVDQSLDDNVNRLASNKERLRHSERKANESQQSLDQNLKLEKTIREQTEYYRNQVRGDCHQDNLEGDVVAPVSSTINNLLDFIIDKVNSKLRPNINNIDIVGRSTSSDTPIFKSRGFAFGVRDNVQVSSGTTTSSSKSKKRKKKKKKKKLDETTTPTSTTHHDEKESVLEEEMTRLYIVNDVNVTTYYFNNKIESV
ncbi:hypothetical protein SAMD00019534_081680 [Acytostelium subglobosum LB1]|uniref:hypothetical protein n=1 Tax=Acytostelium subglobosum LB1 TaxID=1410327 RepID=UPI000644E7A4|nr:hypothetical protein SAMD00019534_081680 [Acytostelium subglobosum LB1]GAM24993.1 hypothetical protein SAMD00019534_081680 [Acytostelium subglobosum LB1]|eukprot:XP_012752082.1 hypothetical protein SAMD00019534_081680 [Acytostelium subglobosum LB1]